MKIRTDFVTNSSSTSFIIIADGELDREEFLKLVGVLEGSPLYPAFDRLYNIILAHMTPADSYQDRRFSECKDLESLVTKKFSADVAEKVIAAKGAGKSVYLGKLSSDEDPIETFFCVDSFELDNGKTYINALNCIW